ncbi:hypothetical protein SAMN04488498_13831 [Mesorhizobium albiziae]|uniref:Uncharacterized protein n=1 Tax=Neomesorhizobium albiziae TaxID=335020 RepID=A0A1I4F8T6_9HYPH|nr:hypothetical protein [Mesorhizobium albiziae]GLS29374.1 hypothetical protein GCM10007937_10820 [Mesorhizobium albiziae]SFL13710.1 hypothetical protein SAMN04488498_13831 [Mesorhizobium albiziae]
MSTRTTHSVVHFSAPFSLTGVDDIQPPGDYAIEEDEEQIDGISWLAYRRVAMFIHLPSVASNSRTTQLIAIDYADLEAAQQQDWTGRDGSG